MSVQDSHSSERNADFLEDKLFWMKMIELSDRAFIYLSIFISLYSMYYINIYFFSVWNKNNSSVLDREL